MANLKICPVIMKSRPRYRERRGAIAVLRRTNLTNLGQIAIAALTLAEHAAVQPRLQSRYVTLMGVWPKIVEPCLGMQQE